MLFPQHEANASIKVLCKQIQCHFKKENQFIEKLYSLQQKEDVILANYKNHKSSPRIYQLNENRDYLKKNRARKIIK